MRTYYVFRIQDAFYHSYFQNPEFLYQILLKFYLGDARDVSLASLYTQICLPHKKSVLTSYLDAICYRKRENHYLLIHKKRKEKTVITVQFSHLRLKSNKNIPYLFRALSYYSQHLLVCDFAHEDYFWLTRVHDQMRLSSQVKKRLSLF